MLNKVAFQKRCCAFGRLLQQQPHLWQEQRTSYMEPTIEQVKECYRVSSELTKMFVSLHLVTLDSRTKEIYIFAGDEIQVLICPNGKTRYL